MQRLEKRESDLLWLNKIKKYKISSDNRSVCSSYTAWLAKRTESPNFSIRDNPLSLIPMILSFVYSNI